MLTSRKKILYLKLFSLSVLAIIIVVAIFLFYHYFYIFDSYYYTAEFHYLFMKNNLKSENVELFKDYFQSMGSFINVFPFLFFSYFVQSYFIPFSKPVLALSVMSAFGMVKGLILSYLSLIFVGLVSFGIGIFFVGDLLPVLNNKFTFFEKINCISKKAFTMVLFIIAFAIPFIPISIISLTGAVIKIPLLRISLSMISGFAVRLLWLSNLYYPLLIKT